jgi:outer membrane lipoprotein-sorting protein
MKMSSKSKKLICYILTAAILSGCATAGKDIAATYVSPVQYSNYDCDQLRQELNRIHGRVNQLTGRLDEAASNDKAIMGVGMILFWPALFALGGTKQQEAELSRLKGEYDALQSASNSKKCST